jgi:two-component system sensor histidine kinase UhpB
MLEHADLNEALKRHCADIEQHHQIKVAYSASSDLGPLRPDVALCLFRVAQEALSNAIRHARAHAIRVHLAASNGSIELGITDDGVGFIPETRTPSGLGLRSIDERVRLVGGTVILDSQPGQGTRLRVRVPFA